MQILCTISTMGSCCLLLLLLSSFAEAFVQKDVSYGLFMKNLPNILSDLQRLRKNRPFEVAQHSQASPELFVNVNETVVREYLQTGNYGEGSSSSISLRKAISFDSLSYPTFPASGLGKDPLAELETARNTGQAFFDFNVIFITHSLNQSAEFNSDMHLALFRMLRKLHQLLLSCSYTLDFGYISFPFQHKIEKGPNNTSRVNLVARINIQNTMPLQESPWDSLMRRTMYPHPLVELGEKFGEMEADWRGTERYKANKLSVGTPIPVQNPNLIAALFENEIKEGEFNKYFRPIFWLKAGLFGMNTADTEKAYSVVLEKELLTMQMDAQTHYKPIYLFENQDAVLGLKLEDSVKSYCSANNGTGTFKQQVAIKFHLLTINHLLEIIGSKISSKDLHDYLAAYQILHKVYRFLQNNSLGLTFREVRFIGPNPFASVEITSEFIFNLEIACTPKGLL